jgi:hypothetical protein
MRILLLLNENIRAIILQPNLYIYFCIYEYNIYVFRHDKVQRLSHTIEYRLI